MTIDFVFMCVVHIDLISVWEGKCDLISVQRWNWFGCCASKTTSFQCGGSALIWFLCRGQKWIVFSVRIEINRLFCVGASKSTWCMSGDQNLLNFCNGVEINFVLFAGIEIGLVLASGSTLTCILCRSQNCVRAEHFLALIYGSKFTWLIAWGLISTWILCAGRKWLVLVRGSIDLVFVRVVEIDLVFVCWPKITWL